MVPSFGFQNYIIKTHIGGETARINMTGSVSFLFSSWKSYEGQQGERGGNTNFIFRKTRIPLLSIFQNICGDAK